MFSSHFFDQHQRGRAFLEAAEARASEALWRHADRLVHEDPGLATVVAAYLAEPIGAAGHEAPAPIEETLGAARIELATIRELLHGLAGSTPLRDALLHELTRASTMHGIVAELRRLGEQDPGFDEVGMRLDVITRLLDEWAD